jgi:hypothetical protein
MGIFAALDQRIATRFSIKAMGADVTGHHPEGRLDDAEVDACDGFRVGLAGEQVLGGDPLAEGGSRQPEVGTGSLRAAWGTALCTWRRVTNGVAAPARFPSK